MVNTKKIKGISKNFVKKTNQEEYKNTLFEKKENETQNKIVCKTNLIN